MRGQDWLRRWNSWSSPPVPIIAPLLRRLNKQSFGAPVMAAAGKAGRAWGRGWLPPNHRRTLGVWPPQHYGAGTCSEGKSDKGG